MEINTKTQKILIINLIVLSILIGCVGLAQVAIGGVGGDECCGPTTCGWEGDTWVCYTDCSLCGDDTSPGGSTGPAYYPEMCDPRAPHYPCWVNRGGPYSCCPFVHPGQICICQDQEYLSQVCTWAYCYITETDERTKKYECVDHCTNSVQDCDEGGVDCGGAYCDPCGCSDNADCDDGNPCTQDICVTPGTASCTNTFWCSGASADCGCEQSDCKNCESFYGTTCGHGTCANDERPVWFCNGTDCEYTCNYDISCTCSAEGGACSTGSDCCAGLFCVENVCRAPIAKACSINNAKDNSIAELGDAIDDVYCTWNIHDGCLVKSGVEIVNGGFNPPYWDGESCGGDPGTSDLFGEKRVFVDDIDDYIIRGRVYIDDVDIISINGARVNALERGCCGYTDWADVTNYFNTGWNTIEFQAIDGCSGGRYFDLEWNISSSATCDNNSDCDDSNPCTNNICLNPGLPSSSCSYPNYCAGTESNCGCTAAQCKDCSGTYGTACGYNGSAQGFCSCSASEKPQWSCNGTNCECSCAYDASCGVIENCCNDVDDDTINGENGADITCRNNRSLAVGNNSVCWWTEWDNYSNNSDYYSGWFSCPTGSVVETVSIYQRLQWWGDHFYIYDSGMTQRYKDGGNDGDKTIDMTSYNTQKVKFRFKSNWLRTSDGVKVNTVTCSTSAPTCDCSSGLCCSDGCNFDGPSFVCDLTYQRDIGCPYGTGCGDDVGVRYKKRYCSGSSSNCTGITSGWGSWGVQDYCDLTETCVDNDSTCNYDDLCVNVTPVAVLSCNPSSCSGYIADGFSFNNDSTDADSTNPPDMDNDIKKSRWYVDGAFDTQYVGSNTMNSFFPGLTAGSHTIKLDVEDNDGLTDIDTQTFTVKRDAIANFMCSVDKEEPKIWHNCATFVPRIFGTQWVYFKDISTVSEDASGISSWKWEQYISETSSWEVFGTVSLAQLRFEKSNRIKLTIIDDVGRSASREYLVGAKIMTGVEFEETI